MKKLAILLLAALLGAAIQAKAARGPEITIRLDENVVLTLDVGSLGDDGEFPCIGIMFSDPDRNWANNTYMEIKRRDGYYYLYEDYGYGRKRYASVGDAVKDALEDNITSFYNSKKEGKKVWKAFVKNGSLRKAIEFVNEGIDDEFLDSPFNDIYG